MWLLIHTGIKAWRTHNRTTINKHNRILCIFDDRDCHKDLLSCRQWPQLCYTDDSRLFHSPLAHGPIGRLVSAVTAVQRDCHWGLKNDGNSHWSRGHIMQWGSKQSQSIFRPTNHKNVDASQMEAVSHTQLTLLLPPGRDCVAVYYNSVFF